MKVLLIASRTNPTTASSNEYVGVTEPLALEYIGAGVRQNHDVKLLDLRVEKKVTLKDTLESFQPDIIGCGGCSVDVNPAKKICAEAKKIHPGILTVVGGHHATVVPGDYFDDDNVDVVVSGEGVLPFKKICDNYEKQKNFKDFQDIENIYYRSKESNGNMIFTKKKEHPPLDDIPFPDRSLTSHLRDKYTIYYAKGSHAYACIRGSVGCRYRCNFCVISSMMNYQILRRNTDPIIEELAGLKENIIFWTDDEFFIEPERAVNLAKEICKAGIKKTHRFYARADNIAKHPECVEEWAKAGMDVVLIGLEGHRDKDLTRLGKGINTSKNEEAVHICHQNGVKVKGNFIVHQDFDKEDFRSRAEYTRELEVDFPSFSVFTPLPGTKLFEELKDSFITHNLDFFDLAHTVLPTKLPLKQFYKELTNTYARAQTPKMKREILKQMTPAMTWKMIKLSSRLKNLYRDYKYI